MVSVIGEDKTVLKETSCRGCGARLQYGMNEVQTRNGTDYSGGPDGEDYIMCPRCGNKVVLRSW